MPLKNAGIHIGNTTASFRSFFASSKSAISSLKKQVRQRLYLAVLRKAGDHATKAATHTPLHGG